MNDLILLTDIPSKVQKASVKHGLNKSQTKALTKLEQVSDKAFHDVTQKYFVPQPLVLSVILQEKKDQERLKDLNWGLRTWDNWYFNDVDHRFGDDWPGRIPARLVAHTLFYFTQENDLVFDPMADGGVVADTCLAFNRR